MIGSYPRVVLAVVVLAGVALSSRTAFAYQTVMLRDSGPSGNRVNIVILGDGYLTSELGQLEADARTALASIGQEPFYAEYASYINVKLVLTSSPTNTIGNGS